MSGESNSKRRKMSGYKKNKPFRSHKPAKFLEPGIKGFLATCNFREKDCVRECYNLLNEYANLDEKNTETDETILHQVKIDDASESDDIEEEDISTQLENEIKTITASSKLDRTRFQQIETKTPNCVFIKTTVADPIDLGVKIVRDIAATKKQKTRILLRFIPVEVVCKASVEDIKNAAGKLFDKYFLNVEPKTFSIVVNKRYNNSVDRMAIIRELADIVAFKNVQHKVDLKNAELSVVVEIIKGLCCLTVLPDYNELKKFNLVELGIAKEDKPKIDAETKVKVNDDIDVKEEVKGNDDVDVKQIPNDETTESTSTVKSIDASTEVDQNPKSVKDEATVEEDAAAAIDDSANNISK